MNILLQTSVLTAQNTTFRTIIIVICLVYCNYRPGVSPSDITRDDYIISNKTLRTKTIASNIKQRPVHLPCIRRTIEKACLSHYMTDLHVTLCGISLSTHI